ncbi:hypothetical protein MWU57_08015 [Isoptericola sp. S6320L]|uniref:hypothetical protein n=1 Tax=Isoptericola sp. S6320L TaxID=2926411 RepID=UPI001FF3562A|nr:hypothetical protein [Isoptericola sp. S6320L]MCK0116979.1 hypothetical protein [Isoptericola sp. S6320L]
MATLTSGSWWDPLDWEGFVDGIIEGMGDALVWLLNLAFNNPLTVISASEWQAAFGQAAKWGGVFAVVAVAICAVEIIAGMISSDQGRILRGWVWAILAWPLTAASLLVYSRLVNASDWLTTGILNSITAPEVVAGSAAVTGATSAATTAMVSMLLGVSALSTWWLALIFVGLAMLPVIGLVIVLGIVTFGQIALAAFAPVALMLIGFRGTRAMSSKWLQMAVALLLTKPIAAGIVALGCALGSEGGADGLILGIIAITMAVGSPALAFSFVGFAGAQLGGAMTAHADKLKGLTNSMTQAGANQGMAALRERLGGSAKAAAATVGAGAGGADAGSAGFSGSAPTTTTAAGSGSPRPSASDPHSKTGNAAKGQGEGRGAGQRGATGSGKGSGETGRDTARGSRDPANGGSAAGVHDNQVGGRASTADPAATGFHDVAGPSVADTGYDWAGLDSADAPAQDGWPDDTVPAAPVDDGQVSGDASRLAGPVGDSAQPLAGQASSSETTGQPADPAGAARAPTSGARGAASSDGSGSRALSGESGSGASAGRNDTTSNASRPAGGTAPRRQSGGGAGASPGTAPRSGTSETRAEPGPSAAGPSAPAGHASTPPTPRHEQPSEPERPGRPPSDNPKTPDPAPSAEPETESGPNPFGGDQ